MHKMVGYLYEFRRSPVACVQFVRTTLLPFGSAIINHQMLIFGARPNLILEQRHGYVVVEHFSSLRMYVINHTAVNILINAHENKLIASRKLFSMLILDISLISHRFGSSQRFWSCLITLKRLNLFCCCKKS